MNFITKKERKHCVTLKDKNHAWAWKEAQNKKGISTSDVINEALEFTQKNLKEFRKFIGVQK